MECTEFFKASGWRCATVPVRAHQTCLYVSLPVSFATGRPCDIYLLEDSAGRITLSDDGDTLSHFHSAGFELDDKRRWRGLAGIANNHGLELTDEGELTATFSREKLPEVINQLLQFFSAIIAWEKDRYEAGDQDYSLTQEVERLLHVLEPGREVTPSPTLSTPSGSVSFDFKWGDTYVDAIRPNAQSVNSRLRKAVMVQGEDAPEILFVIDDRVSRTKAESELSVLGSLASTTLLSDMQHRAGGGLNLH
ncbi:DUF1828 domain-containing protein [Vreelandella sp.]|uniref:DUF1828 domain-containing protein n=1 Tax=Vreelandella sp. TaxID=3137778 RepID=UPI003BA8B95E